MSSQERFFICLYLMPRFLMTPFLSHYSRFYFPGNFRFYSHLTLLITFNLHESNSGSLNTGSICNENYVPTFCCVTNLIIPKLNGNKQFSIFTVSMEEFGQGLKGVDCVSTLPSTGKTQQSGMIHKWGLKTREPVCDLYKVLTIQRPQGSQTWNSGL